MGKKQSRQKESGHMLLYLLVGLLVVAVLALAVWRIHGHKKSITPKTSSKTTQTSNQVDSASSDLTTDLNSVNSSLTQEGSSQDGATNAVNDQQNVVSVPTN